MRRDALSPCRRSRPGRARRLVEDVFEVPDDVHLLAASLLTATVANAEEIYLSGQSIGSDGEAQGTPVDDSESGTRSMTRSPRTTKGRLGRPFAPSAPRRSGIYEGQET